MIGGQTKYNKILQFSICNTMKTVNYMGASNTYASITDLCTSQQYCYHFGSAKLPLAGYSSNYGTYFVGFGHHYALMTINNPA